MPRGEEKDKPIRDKATLELGTQQPGSEDGGPGEGTARQDGRKGLPVCNVRLGAGDEWDLALSVVEGHTRRSHRPRRGGSARDAGHTRGRGTLYARRGGQLASEKAPAAVDLGEIEEGLWDGESPGAWA